MKLKFDTESIGNTRAWPAGCPIGEEPASLAMTLLKNVLEVSPGQVKISPEYTNYPD